MVDLKLLRLAMKTAKSITERSGFKSFHPAFVELMADDILSALREAMKMQMERDCAVINDERERAGKLQYHRQMFQDRHAGRLNGLEAATEQIRRAFAEREER